MMDNSTLRGLQFMRELRKELEGGKLVLPAFPDVAMRVRTALGNPYVTVPKVVTVVSTEPVLTARLLKMANSVLVAAPGVRVKDIHTAISRLGFTMVRNAAISVAVEQMMAARSMGELKAMLKELWQHSVQVAAMAYVIAKHTRVVSPDDALLAGLLHDMGKFYILQRADACPELFGPDQEPELAELLERWHGVTGHTMLRSWNFPPEMIAAVEQHEQLDRKAERADLADIVLVANLHANIRKPRKRSWDTVPSFERLQLTPEQSVALMDDARSKIAEVQRALSGV
jgi:putative nucleotidyltransferase with HDIG domain